MQEAENIAISTDLFFTWCPSTYTCMALFSTCTKSAISPHKDSYVHIEPCRENIEVTLAPLIMKQATCDNEIGL